MNTLSLCGRRFRFGVLNSKNHSELLVDFPYIGFIKSAYTLLFLMKNRLATSKKVSYMRVKNRVKQKIV